MATQHTESVAPHREQAILVGVRAIKEFEATFHKSLLEESWDRFVGEPRHWAVSSDRAEFAARTVVDALIAEGLLRP